MNNVLVYVAGPYTLGDVAINVHNMIKACDEIAKEGYGVYCPLLTHFWHLVSPHPYEFWIAQDNVILPRCDCLVRLEGKSSGADKEVQQMVDLRKPVFFSLFDLFNSDFCKGEIE